MLTSIFILGSLLSQIGIAMEITRRAEKIEKKQKEILEKLEEKIQEKVDEVLKKVSELRDDLFQMIEEGYFEKE